MKHFFMIALTLCVLVVPALANPEGEQQSRYLDDNEFKSEIREFINLSIALSQEVDLTQLSEEQLNALRQQRERRAHIRARLYVPLSTREKVKNANERINRLNSIQRSLNTMKVVPGELSPEELSQKIDECQALRREYESILNLLKKDIEILRNLPEARPGEDESQDH